jgi:DNA-binding MarR family transcriptional regulator
MSLLQDLLKEVSLSESLKKRVTAAEEKFNRASKEIEVCKERIAELVRENEKLRAQLPAAPRIALTPETARVLLCLHKADLEGGDVGMIAKKLRMDMSAVQSHLEQLAEARLAGVVGGNFVRGHVYWGLTPEGKRYLAERKSKKPK